MVKGELAYNRSASLGRDLYSKNVGIGYRSHLGDDEGSEIFLSTMGCLPKGIVGFPALTGCIVDVFLKFILLCMIDYLLLFFILKNVP
jgi:hypothetical protein